MSQSSQQIAASIESTSLPPFTGTSANRYLSVSHSQLEDQRRKQKEELSKKTSTYMKNGKAKLLQKNYSEAISTFQDVLEFSPQNYEAKFYLGLSFLDSDDVNQAIDFFNEVILNSRQQAPLAYILLSIAYKRQNNLPQTIESLTLCITSFPKYPDAHLARGQGYLLQD
jgi:tetratricopeptide (TPR) repeat protein